MCAFHDTGRATKSPRASSYGEDSRALPAIPDQLNALGLTTIPEDGLASLGKQLPLVSAVVQHAASHLHWCMNLGDQLPLVTAACNMQSLDCTVAQSLSSSCWL